eukprot:Clim_evm38s22 gene=Clim_evmTU38s22
MPVGVPTGDDGTTEIGDNPVTADRDHDDNWAFLPPLHRGHEIYAALLQSLSGTWEDDLPKLARMSHVIGTGSLVGAFDLLDRRCVTRLTLGGRETELYRTDDDRGQHVVMALESTCTCSFFQKAVSVGKALVCKHVLACHLIPIYYSSEKLQSGHLEEPIPVRDVSAQEFCFLLQFDEMDA